MEEMLGRFGSCLDGLGSAAKVAPFTAAGTGVQLAQARLGRGAEDAAGLGDGHHIVVRRLSGGGDVGADPTGARPVLLAQQPPSRVPSFLASLTIRRAWATSGKTTLAAPAYPMPPSTTQPRSFRGSTTVPAWARR